MAFQARRCRDCGLRFPVAAQSELGRRCPVCAGDAEFVDEPYTTDGVSRTSGGPGPRVEALFDNIRSLRNVGSMFRSADGAGVAHLHLGGFTPTPEHPKLAKTSLGAEKWVAWTHHKDPVRAAQSLAETHRLWALEGGRDAVGLFGLGPDVGAKDSPPIVLVLGHEVSGIDPRVLDSCERRVSIPMAGVKGSLNVSVAFGIAVYALRHTLR